MGSQLNRQPPAILERIVRWLVPPASREHVLGDLSERYQSPWRYLRDALAVVPFVVGTQIRRNSSIPVLGIVGFTAYGTFQSRSVSSWLVAAIPTLIFIGTLALRDAYRSADTGLTRESAIDVGLGALLVLVWQAIAAWALPEFLLPRPVLAAMFPFLCAVTFLVRMQRAPAGQWPPGVARAMSKAELEKEIRGAESVWRRAIRIELGAALFMTTIAGLSIVRAKNSIGQVIGVLMMSGALFVAWFLYTRARPIMMPNGLGFADAVQHYRRTLQFRYEASRTYMWWYALPLAPAPVVITVAMAMKSPEPLPALVRGIVGIALVGVMLYALSRIARNKLQRRIAQLEQVTERP